MDMLLGIGGGEIGVPGLAGEGGVQADPAHPLGDLMALGDAVLHGLERANGAPEHHALAHIVDGEGDGGRGRTGAFQCQGHP